MGLQKNFFFRDDALKSFEELVQCGICLDKLTDPRMLPCQHTFCHACLEKQLMAQNLLQNTQSSSVGTKAILTCCLCQNSNVLEQGIVSLRKLPRNLHVESLLKLMEEEQSPKTPKAVDYKCAKCNTISQQEEHICQHCMQVIM